MKIANPDGDCFRKFIATLELLLLPQFFEVGGFRVLLLPLDGEECTVVEYAVDEKWVTGTLHLDVQKAVVLRVGEDIQRGGTPFRNFELYLVLELELEIVNLAALFKVEDGVQKVGEGRLVVEKFPEGRLECRIEVLDPLENIGNFALVGFFFAFVV